MPNILEIKFLEFLEPKDGIVKDVDVTSFLMSFPVPNLEDLEASFYDTDALYFLRKCDSNGYWSYDPNLLSPIYNKWVYDNKGKTIRYWIDTLQLKLHVRITDLGIDALYEYRTNEILKLTNNSIIETNQTIRDNSDAQTNILMWTVVFAALSFGVSVINLIINWPNKEKKPSLQLIINSPNTQSQQKQTPLSPPTNDTSLGLAAKKTCPKKIRFSSHGLTGI